MRLRRHSSQLFVVYGDDAHAHGRSVVDERAHRIAGKRVYGIDPFML
jgi:hypothetical protein